MVSRTTLFGLLILFMPCYVFSSSKGPVVIDVPKMHMRGITEADLQQEEKEKQQAERDAKRAAAVAAKLRKSRLGKKVVIQVPTMHMQGTAQ